ncbi:MAG: ureidoglycolate lyase [Colwellia sp.]|nr:ureidoglycolate lyase [Colwellia sp.]
MTELTLTLSPLSAEAFIPFGDVIELSENNKVIDINYGLTKRHHDLANVDVGDNDGKAIISLFHSNPITLPFEVKIMERHPLGSQAFLPLQDQKQGNAYVIIVAPAGEFEQANLQAFLAQPNQGVNYHKGTWHHYCLVLNQTTTFAVIDRGGEGNNCDEVEINDGVTIRVIES